MTRNGAAAWAVALAAALLAAAAAAQGPLACPIQYSNVESPLLFGGRINATCQRIADGAPCAQTPSPWCVFQLQPSPAR